MDEIWKDIKGYEELYQVSNMGRVKSLKRGAILKPSHNGCGYLKFVLSKNNNQKTFYIHRLVAEAFIPNLGNKPQVNHIDGNKENNIVSNLEWSIAKDNILHSYRKLGKEAVTNNAHEANMIRCEVFDKTTSTVKVFNSIREAEIFYGVYHNTFSRAINKQSGNMRKYKIRKLD